MAEKLGIYIHNPFCIQKCKYCDFTSYVKEPDAAYYDFLCTEIKRLSELCNASERFSVDTIFFGGGTPSLVNPEYLSKILETVSECFPLAFKPEISIEANPETITEDSIKELKDIGFNRISLGIQSLDDNVLRAIGRVHDADKAEEALSLAAHYFKNFNADLMIGLPEQSVDSYIESFERVLAYSPNHLSFYSLQLEEGTRLYTEYKNGDIELPTWEENRQMYSYTVENLNFTGYHHYEVSNAAQPGFECKHNLKYWNMQPYLGIGDSAHSFIDNKRFYYEGEHIVYEEHAPSSLKGDFIFTELRLVDGFKLEDYKKLFCSDFLEDHKSAVSELLSEGLIEVSSNTVKLSYKGLNNTNQVMKKLLNE